MTIRFRTLAAAVACAAVSIAAYAKVFIHHVYVGNFTFTDPEVQVPIEKNDSGTVYSHRFNIAKAGVYLFTYSAECSVSAPAGSQTAWIDIDLMDIDLVLAPTVGRADAFCSSNGSGSFGQWTRASITIPVYFAAGPHEISVKAHLNNGATGGWLGDSVTMIHQ